MPHTMTKNAAVKLFRAMVLPEVRRRYEGDGVPDYIARSEAWNDWTDELCKSGQITPEQYDTWTHPPECVAPWERVG